jgi:hypothetical protein
MVYKNFNTQRAIFKRSIEDEVPNSLLMAFELCLKYNNMAIKELLNLGNSNILPTNDTKIMEAYFKYRIDDMRIEMESILYNGLKAKYTHKHVEG